MDLFGFDAMVFSFWAGLTFWQSVVVGFTAFYAYIVFCQIVRQGFQIHFFKKCLDTESVETLKEVNNSRLWMIFLRNPFISLFTFIGTSMQMVALCFQIVFSATRFFMNKERNLDLKVGFSSVFSPVDPLQALILVGDSTVQYKPTELVNIAGRFRIPMIFLFLAGSMKNDTQKLQNLIVMAHTCLRLSMKTMVLIDVKCGNGVEDTLECSKAIVKMLNDSVEKNFSERCDSLALGLQNMTLLVEVPEDLKTLI